VAQSRYISQSRRLCQAKLGRALHTLYLCLGLMASAQSRGRACPRADGDGVASENWNPVSVVANPFCETGLKRKNQPADELTLTARIRLRRPGD
jgi:hypothetical protein